jgi:hypothetical protein
MLNLNAMFNTSCDVFDTRVGDNEVNNKSLDADYLLNDLSSSLNAISSQFSALMSSHNRISDMYSYIRLYGVDRACVQVYNRDGLLTDLSNGVVPATEDFRESNVSKYTIACMEGLGEAIIKIFKWCWEKLKAIGKWIGEKVVAAFNWILSIFKSDKKKEMTIGEAIEELAKVKGEAKAKMDEIVKRFNASSSSNKITGVEDMSSSSAPKYTYEERKGANEIMNNIRDIIGNLNHWVKFSRKQLSANIKKINTFTTIIDRYGDAVDDDSKFEEAYKRAMSETAENAYNSDLKGRTGENNNNPQWTSYNTAEDTDGKIKLVPTGTSPNPEYIDIKENMNKLTAKLKNVASNPLRFADFNELKNSFNQQRSLRSQFEDIMAEAKSLAEQSQEQLRNVCERGQNVIDKLNKVPYDHFVITHRHATSSDKGTKAWRENMPPEAKEIKNNTRNFAGLEEEIKRIKQNANVVEYIVGAATRMSKVFKMNMDIYDDTIKGITRQMKNQQQEDE